MLPYVLALSFLSAPSRCADLTGQYFVQGEDSQTYISIAQAQCARLVITWENSSVPRAPVAHRLVLDGRFHADARWFGGDPSQQTAASLKNGSLEIKMILDGLFLTLRLTLLADGDLCVTDSTVPERPFRAIRQRAPGQTRQNDAARLTQPSCVPQ